MRSEAYGQRWASLGADTTASSGIAVTASATADTKGSWVELVSAAPHRVAGLQLVISTDTAFAGYLIDIAVGAASSEQVLIPNLLVQAAAGLPCVYTFPLDVPAGTRLSARAQSTTGSAVAYVGVVGRSPTWGWPGSYGQVVAMGADTSDTGSTITVDPGGTAHTKGAYSQVSASTPARFRALVATITGRGNAALSDATWLVDIAVGAASSEQVLIPNLHAIATASNDSVLPGPWPAAFVDIPAGTRLSARAQCSITNASDRQVEAVIYGVR